MERDYQRDLIIATEHAWEDPAVLNVMITCGTGGGKTYTFCKIIIRRDVPTCVIAHRSELVSQVALTLNRERIPHDIIAPRKLVQAIVQAQYRLHGYSCHKPRAQVRVASVDTVIRRDPTDSWFERVQLVVIDEGHHVTEGSKWDRARLMFPRARCLLATAHAVRADGIGLGRGHGGIVDRLVVGPHVRALIDRGYLTDYRLVCCDSDVDYSDVDLTSGGEFNHVKLCAAVHRSDGFVGSVVEEYIRKTPGKLGLTFAVDVRSAGEIATEFNRRDIPAAVITKDTDLLVRVGFMEKFRERKLLELVSVDCLGEGTDVPACEVVSMARRTASWQLYGQQAGRGCRVHVAPEYGAVWDQYSDDQRKEIIAVGPKPTWTLIDHVGNVAYHWESRGTLFDGPQVYSLFNRPKGAKAKSDAIPLRYCVNKLCAHPYERILSKCPRCGTPTPLPAAKGTPEAVGGNLDYLSDEVLQRLQQQAADTLGACFMPSGASADIQRAILRRHHARAKAQVSLRAAMVKWGSWRLAVGDTRAECQGRFFHNFGIDMLTAQSLGAPDAEDLQKRIEAKLAPLGLEFAA